MVCKTCVTFVPMVRSAFLAAVALVLVSAVAASAAAADPTALITAGGAGNDRLYSLDLTTGQTSTIGPITTAAPVGAMARAANLALYGVAVHGSPPATPSAFSIDAANAGSSSLFSMGAVGAVDAVPALAFGPEGSLWMSSVRSQESGGELELVSALWSVDLLTEQTSLLKVVGEHGLSYVSGLAEGCDEKMYAAFFDGSGWHLKTVNLATGALTEVGPIVGPNTEGELDIAFDHADDVLYAIASDGSLYVLNPATGAPGAPITVHSGSSTLTEIESIAIDATASCPPPSTGTGGTSGPGPTGMGSSSPASQTPSNRFQLGALRRDKRKGTATLALVVPGPGSLKLSGKGVVGAGATSSAAGTVNLPVRPKGKTKAKLKRTGKAKVTLAVTFTPTGGSAGTESEAAKLLESK